MKSLLIFLLMLNVVEVQASDRCNLSLNKTDISHNFKLIRALESKGYNLSYNDNDVNLKFYYEEGFRWRVIGDEGWIPVTACTVEIKYRSIEEKEISFVNFFDRNFRSHNCIRLALRAVRVLPNCR